MVRDSTEVQRNTGLLHTVDVTLTDASLLQPVLWTLSCLWTLRVQSCLQIHLTSSPWRRWNCQPWAAQQQERNLRRMRWPWLKLFYRWPRKSWCHRWENILSVNSGGGHQIFVKLTICLMSRSKRETLWRMLFLSSSVWRTCWKSNTHLSWNTLWRTYRWCIQTWLDIRDVPPPSLLL